jgi:hypothetical protein
MDGTVARIRFATPSTLTSSAFRTRSVVCSSISAHPFAPAFATAMLAAPICSPATADRGPHGVVITHVDEEDDRPPASCRHALGVASGRPDGDP